MGLTMVTLTCERPGCTTEVTYPEVSIEHRRKTYGIVTCREHMASKGSFDPGVNRR